jgi:zinc protease
MSVDRQQLPVPGLPPGIRFPPVVRSTLAEGLHLWSVQRRDLPLVSLLWLWHAGTADDAAGRPGLAALTADLLDEGTTSLSMAALHDALARVGGHLSTDIGHDATVLSLMALSAHRAQAVDLLLSMAERPRFDPADVQRVRALRLNRLRQLRHSASALADLVAMQHLYGSHPYGQPGIGTEEALAAFEVEDVRAAHARLSQVPATIIAVGDISHDELERLVRAHLDARDRRLRRAAAAAVGDEASKLVFVPRSGAAQSEIRVGRIAVDRRTPDYHALMVANTLIGGAFVSRVNLKLREEKGVTYGARSAFQFLSQPGPFFVQASVQSDATAASVRDVLDELEALGTTRPATGEELESARNALTRGYARGFETAEQVARAAAQLALFDLPHDTFDAFTDAVQGVTAEDVTRMARQWLPSAAMHAVVVGEPRTALPGLADVGLGTPEERLADDVLAR